jgi:hypothetical protein
MIFLPVPILHWVLFAEMISFFAEIGSSCTNWETDLLYLCQNSCDFSKNAVTWTKLQNVSLLASVQMAKSVGFSCCVWF